MFSFSESKFKKDGQHLYSNFRWLLYAALAVLLPFFFFGGPGWTAGMLFKSAWNLGHILFFALLTQAVRPWLWWDGWRLWLATTAVVLAMGGGIELLQSELSREVDWHDMLRNLIGTWLVLAWHRPGLWLPKVGGWLVRIAVGTLLVMELADVGTAARHHLGLAGQLPLIYDIEQPHPDRYWKGNVEPSSAYALGASQSLKMMLPTGTFSGVTLASLPSNWDRYRSLNLEIFNPQNSGLTMTLRINDAAHDRGAGMYSDRFNQQLLLNPGRNSISIDLEDIRTAPLDRTMEMDEIQRLMLFSGHLHEPAVVYLLRLRLER